ncbi:AAA family ATPase [Photobacterium ganghwense]|uniref:AAA family ATPase n=1 Tax=Photobacterium ganghwense TaxID=320778 RepID=UPI001A90B25A|nr:AAA family ATPase [Photobacterium ganghwense]QSV13786.1 AAA family ATPase [Photobacterium ganghwense]
MKVLYVWVNQYKQLNNGYHLTRKYNVNLNHKHVEILKNPGYFESLYSKENSIEISSIVGSNGSGKTNLFKLIIESIYSDVDIDYNFFILFEIENEIFVRHNTDFIFPESVKDINRIELLSSSYTIYMNYFIDVLNEKWSERLYHRNDNYKTSIILEPNKKNGELSVKSITNLNRLRFLKYKDKYDFLKNIFEPDSISVSLDYDKIAGVITSETLSDYVDKNENLTRLKNFIQVSMKSANIDDVGGYFNKKIKSRIESLGLNEINELYLRYKATKIANKKYKKANQLDKIIKRELSSFIDKSSTRHENHKYTFPDGKVLSSNDNVKKRKNYGFFNKSVEIQSDYPSKVTFHNTEKRKNISIIPRTPRRKDTVHQIDPRAKREQLIIDIISGEKFSHNENKYLDIVPKSSLEKVTSCLRFKKVDHRNVQKLLDKRIALDDLKFEITPWLKIRLFSESNKEYEGLSSGQKHILNIFLTLSFHFENLNFRYKNVILLLDEVDLGLHPEYQREFIYKLVDFLNVNKELNFQVIISSHSPFILSDIDADRSLLLDSGGESHLSSGRKTFGNNIHSLLSDSFFLHKNIFTGEFSSRVINDCFDDFKNLKKEYDLSSPEVWKKTVKKMLDKIDYYERVADLCGEKFISNSLKSNIEFLKNLDSRARKKRTVEINEDDMESIFRKYPELRGILK